MAVSELEKVQRLNQLRFSWHEKVIADAEVRKHPNALALSGYIMHRFHVGKGYAEFSNNSAAKDLNMEPRSVIRAKRVLEDRGWLALKEAYVPGKRSWSANRYTIAGGPDDLILDEHKPRGVDGTDVDDSAEIPS